MTKHIEDCWADFAQSGSVTAYLRYRDCVRAAEEKAAAEAAKETAAVPAAGGGRSEKVGYC